MGPVQDGSYGVVGTLQFMVYVYRLSLQASSRTLTHNWLIDKNANGKVIVPWPGTVLHYYAATEIIRWEDFELEYEDPADKYASFGNGVTADGFFPDQFPWVISPISQQDPVQVKRELPSGALGFYDKIRKSIRIFLQWQD